MNWLNARICHTIGLLLLISVLTGCSHFHFPFERQLKVQQGNIITTDMINQLKPGMTKQQVSFIMGTALLSSPFDSHRWNYIYTYQVGNGPVDFRSVAIIFNKENKLQRVDTHRVTNSLPTVPSAHLKKSDLAQDNEKTSKPKKPVDATPSGQPKVRGSVSATNSQKTGTQPGQAP